MQLKPKDFFGNGYENLETGPCGPVYVASIEREEGRFNPWELAGSFNYPSRNDTWRVTIECDNPSVINSILGQIKNIVACPFEENNDDSEIRLRCLGVVTDEDALPSYANVGDFYYYKNKGGLYMWVGNTWDSIQPYVDPVQELTHNIQEEMVKTLNDEIKQHLMKTSRYKLRHKTLYRC